jgi:6-phosphogluconolactonase
MAQYLYVALGGDNKISILKHNPSEGQIQHQDDVGLEGDPGPLCVDPDRKFLFVGLWATRQVASFRIDKSTGKLDLVGTISVGAYSSCLNTDRRGRFLLSCSCGGGIIGIHSIQRDGAVTPEPVQWINTMHGPHWIQTDSSNQYLFVSHVAHKPGSNAILQFLFDEKTGRLTPNGTPKVDQPENTGPRDYAFHPAKPFVYCDNEQNSSVTAYRLHGADGTLRVLQNVPTLPNGFTEENECAQIRVHPSGRFLYVSNRGHDSIACFGIDVATGMLSQIGHQKTEKNPRAFSIDPTGNFLFVGGLDTGRIASYRITRDTGQLIPLDPSYVGERPMWILSLELET